MCDAGQRQREAKLQGEFWEDICVALLDMAGWQIIERRVKYDGLEVDIIANNQDDVSVFFNCKGSFTGERPGLVRDDTVKKMIAEIMTQTRNGWTPHIVLTTHMPKPGSAGNTVLRAGIEQLGRSRLFDVLQPMYEYHRLQELAQATETEMKAEIMKHPSLSQMLDERSWQARRPNHRLQPTAELAGQQSFALVGSNS